MTGLCLGWAGVAAAFVAAPAFTLAWTHTVEKVRWEEDYRLDGPRLVLVEARVKGSGAGMEVPDGAVLEGGAWRYRPRTAAPPVLRLGRTPEAGDYEICVDGHCRTIAAWIGPPRPDRPFVELWSCADHGDIGAGRGRESAPPQGAPRRYPGVGPSTAMMDASRSESPSGFGR